VRRVTFDTNIFVSAFEFGGKPEKLLQMAMDGEIEVAVSQPIVNETVRVLREKFNWSPVELDRVLSVIRLCTKWVSPTQNIDAVPTDADDNRVVECAVASGSEAIITGDKDLLRLGQYEGIRMMRVGEFLERLL